MNVLGSVPAALSIRRVSKRYGSVPALIDVSFDVAPATVHALVGANGSGKSTLIRVVAGIDRAEPGSSVKVAGHHLDLQRPSPAAAHRAGVRVQHQQAGIFSALTVAENLALGARFAAGGLRPIRWGGLHRWAAEVLEPFDIRASPRMLAGDLAPAARVLVAVARALADVSDASPALLVLDEPTGALPRPEIDRLLAGLRRLVEQGHTVMLVTHRLDEVARATDAVTVLRDGRDVATGPTGDFDHDLMVELMTGNSGDSPSNTEAPSRSHPPRRFVEVSELAADAVDGISLSVADGEILGLAGLLGSGRSTILEAIFGLRRLRAGSVGIDGKAVDVRSPRRAIAAGIALVPESRERASFPDQSVASNLGAADRRGRWRGLRLDRAAERGDAAADVASFGIVASSVEVPLATLSGGNQQKALIARWMRRRPRLLLLDEPTVGVDVSAREQIQRLIRDYVGPGRAAIIVSSDVDELCAIADRVVVVRRGRAVGEVAGRDVDPGTVNRLVHSVAAP